MNEILWTSAAISTIPYPYPGDPALEYGGIYYARANARKGGTDHGLPGEIVLFQVPQRTRPVLMDSPLFSWNATDPPSVRYLVEVSRLEDMSTTVWSESSPTTQLDYPAGVFDWSTTYYWRVTGFDTADEIVGVPSDVGFFVTESVDPPVLISPVDAEVETLTPTFRWNSVAQADQYELLLSANNDLSVPFWTVELRGTSVRYPEDALRLEEEKNYYWQLFALDADGEPISDGSAIASFSVAALAQVELTEPVNTTINTVTPHFKWSNVAGARRYRLQLATNADLSDQVLEIETRSQQYAHSGSPALNRGAVYYWQVNALDRNNELYGKPSEIASFSIAEPNTVTLLSPVDVTIEDLQPQFRWTELAGAETYAFELQKAGQSIVSAEVPNTRLQLTGSQRLEYGSSYQWSIQALDGDAIPVGNRAEAGFQTAAQRKVTLLSPVDAEVSSSRPFFEWQGISDVPGYRMELLEADNDGILWTVSTSQTRVQYPGDPPLVMDTDYRWRVISLDQESRPIGEWSDVAQFRMTNRYLITLTSPVGETVYTLNPTFSWQVNENIARYKITVAEDDALSTVLWSMDEIQTARIQYPSLGVPQLAYGSTYFWTIQGLAEDGTALGDPSGVASFPVSGMRIPEPIAPVEVQVQTLNPNFSWSEVDGAFEYSLLVASDEGLSQVMYQNPHIADLGISYPTSGAIPLEFEKTYYWQIQAFDNNGSPVGDPSQVVLFTTPSSMVEIIIEFGS